MTKIAIKLAHSGYVLRSGGARGADLAFERGAGSAKRIYLASDSTLLAENIARKFHPAWNRCSPYARRLHGRNSFQVLGDDLKTPSDFLICWTPDGCLTHEDRRRATGGTGTAISIADWHKVKVFNLATERHFARLLRFVSK